MSRKRSLKCQSDISFLMVFIFSTADPFKVLLSATAHSLSHDECDVRRFGMACNLRWTNNRRIQLSWGLIKQCPRRCGGEIEGEIILWLLGYIVEMKFYWRWMLIVVMIRAVEIELRSYKLIWSWWEGGLKVRGMGRVVDDFMVSF
jgi:hypothetical protein